MKLYFIGSSSLLHHCIQQALNQGLTVGGVVPTDNETHQWATEHHIPVLSLQKLKRHKSHSFDYLFSIVNPTILDKSILALPQSGTINFHDGPLPRYAGVHATSWAILNGETTHAITWHFMDQGIDTGDILLQSSVDILPDDTAYTFNLRCFNVALNGFNTLLQRMKHGLTPTPQDLSKRTYFSYAKKPMGNGIINWKESAHTIDRLVRSTYYGHHTNDFSSAKCFLTGQWFIVPTLCIRNAPSRVKQGQLIEVDDHHLCVGTGSNGGICIHELLTLTGKKIDLPKLTSALKRNHVTQLPQLSDAEQENFQAFSEQIFKHESFWIKALKQIEPATFPFYHATLKNKSSSPQTKSIQWSMPTEKLALLTQKFSAIPLPSILLAGLLLYLYRINQNDHVSVGLYQTNFDDRLTPLTQKLIHTIRPFTIDRTENISITEWITLVHNYHQKITMHEPFLTDVFYRYSLDNLLAKCIVVHYANDIPQNAIQPIDQIHIQIEITGKLHWLFPTQDPLQYSINRVFKHLDHLFNGFLSASTTIHEISIVPTDEYNIVKRINQTAVKFPANKTIYEVFITQAKQHLHKNAIIEDNHSITYQTLLENVHRLASALQRQGVQQDTFVGIWMNRSIDAIISMLSITAIGAAYAPLRIKDPAARIIRMLTSASIKYVLVRKSEIKKDIIASLPKHIHLFCIKTLLHQSTVQNFKYIPFPSTYPAYVNYTSGTTGEPKGIVISHRNIMRLVKNQNYFDFSDKHTFAHLADLAFDATTFEVWGALLNGGSICVLSPDTILNINAFKKQFKICTALFMTPALLKQVLSEDIAFFDHIHTLVFGGDACDSQTIRLLLNRKKTKRISLQLVNGYGPTETTTFAICSKVNTLPIDATAAPIGKPIHNTTAYVLDKHERVLPLGIKGELYLGGEGLATGYLNNIKETNDRFIQTALGRLYKTGDLAVIDPKTLNFLFQGRVDFQVKLRGFRIELDDIRAHLLKQKPIKNATVHLFPFQGKKRLVAFLVLNNKNKKFNDKEFRDQLRQILPLYMIPKQFIILGSIPLQESGKIDRTSLKNRFIKGSIQGEPGSELKSKKDIVLKLVCQFLSLKSIDQLDNYYSLGGDSITSMQISAKAKALGLKIDPELFLNTSTLLELIQKTTWVKKPNTINLPKKLTFLKLSPIQKWFFNLELKNENYFHQGVLLRLKKHFSAHDISKCLTKIVQTHPILYMSYHKNNAKAKRNQPINKPILIDAFTLGEIKNHAISFKQLLEKIHQDVRIDKAPLIKAALIFVRNEKKQYLYIFAHHLVIDGVSWRVLLADLSELLTQLTKKNKIIKLEQEYCSYYYWSNISFSSDKISEFLHEETFWINQLDTDFLSSISSEVNLVKDSNCIRNKLLDQTADFFKKTLIRRKKYRRVDVILASLIKALQDLVHSHEVLINIEHHGRKISHPPMDLTRTIGWFTTIYPCKFTPIGKALTREYLNYIKAKTHEIPNKGVGYNVIRNCLKSSKLKKYYPAKVSFNYLGNLDRYAGGIVENNFELTTDGIKLYSDPNNTRQHFLDITLWIQNQTLYIEVQYNRLLWNNRQIRSFIKDIHQNIQILSKSVIEDKPCKDYMALSPLQKGMIVHWLDKRYSDTYLVQITIKNSFELNLTHYKNAWELLIKQYEILRLYYDGNLNFLGIIAPNSIKLPWGYFDWSNQTELQKSRSLKQLLCQDLKHSFKIGQAPLLRIIVIKYKANEYITILTHHHILLDGWSTNLLLEKLSINYNELLNKKHVENVTYQNYRQYLDFINQKDKTAAIKFFKKYLKIKEIETPSNIPYVLNQSGNQLIARTETLALPNSLLINAVNYTKKNKCTLNNLFQAAYVILLSNYMNSSSLIFGITFAYRPLELNYINQQIGLYINTLPFRVDLSSESSVAEIMQTIQSDMRSMQKYGFVSLLDLRKDTELSNRVDFNTLYVFENIPKPDEKILFRLYDVNNFTHYPFNFIVFPQDRLIKIIYDSNKFCREHIHNISRDYSVILSSILAGENPKIFDILKLLGNTRLKNINKKPSKISVIDLFQKVVSEYPRHIALEHSNHKITYQDVDIYSNTVAAYLAERPRLLKTNIVPVLINKSEALIYCILGILKSNNAYSSIDVEYPAERIIYMVKKLKSNFIITQKKNIKFCKALIKNKINIIFIEDILENSKNDTRPRNINSHKTKHSALFNIVFTSGSTGNPKGVMVKHESVINLIKNQISAFEINPNTRVLSFSSIGFDAFTSEFFTSITTGATLVLPETKDDLIGTGLFKFLKEKCINVVTLPPSVLSTLPKKTELPHLQVLVIAGESPWKDLVQKWTRPNLKLINAYGPTEATVCSTMNTTLDYNNPTNIGYPLQNTNVYVMDQHNNVLPPGAVGELCIAGIGISLGYINDKKLTNRSFLKVPLNKETITLYRSGDIGTQEKDGSIRYIGREDQQVKINGCRIELNEISKVLLSFDIIKECVVLPKKISQAISTLVAIIVPTKLSKKNGSQVIDKVLKEAAKKLPNYMIPSKIILLDKMPITPNKKIDYTALQLVTTTEGKEETSKISVENRADIYVLLDIWKSVLNVTNIDYRVSFFHSGGNSLLAALLISKINETFLTNIGLESIFMHETFLSFSNYIKQHIRTKRHISTNSSGIPDPIVLLKKNPGDKKLFLIHPVGGNIFWYANLSKYISDNFSLYGIQDPGLITKKLYFSSIEEMSEYYLLMIQKIQTHGPYYIGGASYGATVAFEMAQQLSAKGEKINFIGLFDGWAVYPDEINSQAFMQENMWRQYGEMKKLDKKSRYLLAPYVNLHWHRANIFVKYKLQPIDQTLILFKAKEIMPVLKPIDVPDNHWKKYTNSLVTYSVPGSHETMFYMDNVKKLASILSFCIK
jgi:amino acid adenylation domain-containing protein/non-ribosomal peptide synthase protein (TIGR01720 family)